jgi:hypothetical protein
MTDLYSTPTQRLGVNSLGIVFANTVNAGVTITTASLASAAAAGTAGQTLLVNAQVGQAATGSSNAGGNGGGASYTAAAGGTSALAAGGNGGSLTLSSGAGGAATGGSGNGGNAGDVLINAHAGGTSAQGAAGTNGSIRSQLGGIDYIVLDGTNGSGAGWQPLTTLTIAASGTTTLTATQARFPLIRCGTRTLTNNATLAFPNAIGFWAVDTSGITLSGHTFNLSSGSGTSANITPSVNPTLVWTLGSNTILIR